MTENERLTINGKEITLYREVETNLYRFSKDAVDMLLEALEEREQYRAIGTVEEFKALKEKNTPKKIAYQIGKNGLKHEKCPTCGSFRVFGKHCTECGQAVDYD